MDPNTWLAGQPAGQIFQKKGLPGSIHPTRRRQLFFVEKSGRPAGQPTMYLAPPIHFGLYYWYLYIIRYIFPSVGCIFHIVGCIFLIMGCIFLIMDCVFHIMGGIFVIESADWSRRWNPCGDQAAKSWNQLPASIADGGFTRKKRTNYRH